MELKDFKVGDTVRVAKYGSEVTDNPYLNKIGKVKNFDSPYICVSIDISSNLLCFPHELELIAREAPPKPTNPPGTVWIVEFEHGCTPYIKTDNGKIAFLDKHGNRFYAAPDCESNLDDPTNESVILKHSAERVE